jgi:hypothetical protein
MRLWTIIGMLTVACACVQGQNFSMDWHKVSGGGGSSTGGVYAISGTIGQHDAGGPMIGGGFSLVGGFWALTAVQTPGAPLLSIHNAGGNAALVSWPFTTVAFHLQQCASLDNANWVPVTNSVNLVTGTNQVTISPVVGNQFYRLKFP